MNIKPVKLVNPRFPSKLAMKKIEGYVQMSFSLDEKGKTKDIKVIKSVPEGAFDKQAIKAFTKWRYKPVTIDGEAVVVEGLQIQIDFKLS